MLEVYSYLKELLACLVDRPAVTMVSYQSAYLRFRGLVVDASEHNEVYQQWAQRYLVDVNDETGQIVKLHESTEELKADIDAFIQFMERHEVNL
jgi:elongation factor P--beta-lysine ligase